MRYIEMGLVTSPSYSARLTGESNAVMGLTWAHTVSRGDSLRAEVYTKYNEVATDAASTGILDAFAGAFTTAYGITSTGETAETYNYLVNEVFSAGPLFSGEADQTLPKAYINYLFFDKDFIFRPEHSGFQQVSSLALEDGSCSGPAFDPDKGCEHEKLSFDIIAPEDGSYYVYFSNESEKVWEVFFDDFKVTLDQKYVSETTDFYPFGLVMRQSRFNTEESYRFGYQGQFSEEDDETGFSHFQYRDYDAVIGRWIIVDPARQHFSPYLAMSNNPIVFIDPNGLTDWPALLQATLAIAGGAAETIAGVAASKTIIGATVGVPLAADGISRIYYNGIKFYHAFTEESSFSVEARTSVINAGQNLGRYLDEEYGDQNFEESLGLTNDFAALALNAPSFANNLNKIISTNSTVADQILGTTSVLTRYFSIGASVNRQQKSLNFNPLKFCPDCLILDEVVVTPNSNE